MKPIEIIAQSIGILAMAFNILSYQGKKKSTVIGLQLTGALLFAVNFLLLGAYVGGLLNIIAAIRAIVFLFKDRLKADKPAWFIGFIASYVGVYVLNFTLFQKPFTVFNAVIELLPVIGMVALNIGYRLKNAAGVRKCGLLSAPAWLTYNIAAGSVGAIICESFTFVSIGIGIFRHDRKEK